MQIVAHHAVWRDEKNDFSGRQVDLKLQEVCSC